MSQDEQHLKLLSIFHYIVGAMIAFFSCFPMIHLILGIVIIMAPQTMESGGEPPPAFVGWLFAIIGASFILTGWSLAGCVIAAGRFLAKRKHYVFCLVIACVQCIFMPFGTVLGVFTIVVLVRESVKRMFSANKGSEAIVAGATPPQL